MESILYTLGDGLYINLTNRCPCACTFCIRGGHEGVGSADSLWLDSEPNVEQVIAELAALDLSDFGEVVFCGYGEPFCALEVMLEVCRYLKSRGARVRVNTNGLGDLINGKPTVPLLEGLIDVISISLNAPTAEKYAALCKPAYGPAAFDAMLRFAGECKGRLPEVVLSVVDVLPEEDILRCAEIAREMGIAFRIRQAT